MVHRTVKLLRLPAAQLASFVLLLGAVPAWSQTPAPVSSAQFDPSDVYFQAYLARRAAEELEAGGDFIGALEKLQSARQLVEAIRTYYPAWKPEMVTGRIEINHEALTRLHPKAQEQQQQKRNAVAELEGGVQQSGRFIAPEEAVKPPTLGILQIDPLAARRLAEAEAEVKRLRDLATKPSETEVRTESRLRDATRRLAETEAEVKRLRDLAAKPTEAEVRTESALRDATRRLAGTEAEVKRLRDLVSKPTEAEVRTESQLREATRRLAESEAEVKRLRDIAAKPSETEGRTESQLRDANRRLAETEAEVKRLRDIAAKPSETEGRTESQLRDANRRLAESENEVKRLRDLAAKPSETEGRTESQLRDANRRLAETEAEVKRLRNIAANPSDTERRTESRLRDVARQRDATQAQLNAAEKNVQNLRAQLAAKPMEHEMQALNQRIAGIEQERQAMAMALGQSRTQHTEALSRIAILQADLTVMQQTYADLSRDLKAERDVANAVVAGQRTQIQNLEKELAGKNTELGKANDRISSLVDQLQESQASFAQLRTEHNALLQERDQMSALLKLNEDGRIQDLVEQNIGLAKTLREANEKFEGLRLEKGAAEDDVTDALRDLAIAKSQINKLHQEKRDQDQRLAELEKRLRSEETALAGGQVAADPEEVALLRDIIQRQLRVQERRRQARDLLIDAVKDLGTQDERIAQAIQLFDGQEIQLSPDEQRVIADRKVDGEFISPFARDRATVGRNTSELNRDIAIFERTAEKSFAAGRMLPTRELYEMIVEQNPGHIPALCKLGVVHLRLDDAEAAADTFRRACELDATNPFAHRMLGVALLKLDDLTGAEENLKQAAELAPDDMRNYMLLAELTFSLSRFSEAESHLRAAIVANPVASDPHYNLAVLCAREKRLEDARNHYHQALERGAVPDPSLEQRIAIP